MPTAWDELTQAAYLGEATIRYDSTKRHLAKCRLTKCHSTSCHETEHPDFATFFAFQFSKFPYFISLKVFQ